jgi:hypothetical protein
MHLPVNTNGLGLALIVLGGVIAGMGLAVLKLGDAVVMLAIGSAVIVADLIIRFRSRPLQGWLWGAEYGGNFFYLPMWGIGIIAIVGGVANALTH